MATFTNFVVATPSGTATNSVAIAAELTRVITVASANDSVVLPSAAPGQRLVITNAAASNTLRVWAKGSDLINGAANASILAGKINEFFAWSQVTAPGTPPQSVVAGWTTLASA